MTEEKKEVKEVKEIKEVKPVEIELDPVEIQAIISRKRLEKKVKIDGKSMDVVLLNSRRNKKKK